MVKAQVFTIAKNFEGELKESDLQLQEEELPPLQDGEILVECLYLSVDPFMKSYSHVFEVGQVMVGNQVAKIIESKNEDFPVEKTIVGYFGWRTHTIVNPKTHNHCYPTPDMGHLPKSLALGALGFTGAAAYFSLEVCNAKEGDTVVINAAAGAVGNQAGQIAKLQGCRVIGITGSEEKAHWLESMGFHYVINYKSTKTLEEDLKKGAPKGIDCFIDNVGGEISTIVMNQMNKKGRVVVVGAISAYSSRVPIRASIVQPAIYYNNLTVYGFNVLDYKNRFNEFIQQNLKWIQENKLKYRETFSDGFENATKALLGVLKGQSIGKSVVRVKAPHVENESLNFRDALGKFKKINVR